MTGSTITLGGMLESVGNNVIQVVAGRLTSSYVESVSIYDVYDLAQRLTDAIVLGVGVVGAEAIEDFIGLAIEQHAAAVVLREPIAVPPEVLRAAANSGIVVLGVIGGVDWSHLTSTLSKALEDPFARDESSAASDLSATDQLSNIANALADLLDAPVTIEDTNSRVLAFSRNQNEGDDTRKETILHRQVPKLYRDQMKHDGVFRRIYSSERPVYFESSLLVGHGLSRTVVRVMSGKVVVGSIWVATASPLSETDVDLLLQTSREVSSILDHVHFENGREGSRRRHLVAQLLSGGREADVLARRLGIQDNDFCLFVLSAHGSESVTTESQLLMQMADSFNLHLSSYNAGSAATVWGSTVVGVLPVDPRTPDSFVMQVAQRFIDRARRKIGLHIVVSPIVAQASELKIAHDEAIRTLQVMNDWSASSVSRVSRTEDAFIDVILMEVRDKLAESWSTRRTPVRRLVEYDREHGTTFVETLDAHFAHFGAVIQAAASIHVHPNTFRYRLKRLHEICGIDVTDNESRFRALLELKLLELGKSATAEAPLRLRSVNE